MGTKSSPSCYHGAVRYAAQITGISLRKEIYFTNSEHLRTTPHKNRNTSVKFKSKLRFKAADIRIETECGKTVSYFPEANKRFDELYKAKRIIVTIDRPLNEFGIDWMWAGKHKDSLGDGWHQTVALYRHNDFYYAPMECACS